MASQVHPPGSQYTDDCPPYTEDYPPTTNSGVVLDEYDPGPTDPMDETDFGNRYVVYVSQVSVAQEPEFCRHAIMAPTNYEAAANAVRECRLTVYGTTVIAEVFAHPGGSYRFSYQLTYHA